MAGEKGISTSQNPERAILVGIDLGQPQWGPEVSLPELERLANTAGAVVVGRVTQRMEHPNPRTFIGSGKAAEVAELCRSLDAQVVILDDEITPSQQRNLESIVPKSVKVIDRTALILDIFGLHATTREGRLQVRLAQNKYLYPRLRGMWAHLASNRMGGGVGSRFGEGESQLEVDRRMVRKRITSITRELKDVTANRFDGHFFTGLVGIPILTQWLTEAGEAQFFYSLLKQRSYPGYLYMIDNGATTTWEHWEATRSRIHNCYNGIGSWFYQALGGIVPDESQPGYKHFYLHPQPVDGVSYVRVTRPCPYGNITVDWNKTDKVLDMKVVVPAGTTATLTVPFKASRVEIPTTNHIRQGIIYNETQKGMPDQQTIESKDPSKPVELTSGSYRIIYYKD